MSGAATCGHIADHNFAAAGSQQSRRSNVVPKLPVGSSAVAEQVDFQQEAEGCFRLAEREAHSDIRTILMGMGYGWLTLASHRKTAARNAHAEPFEEPTEEPDDML
jgi:hypothetical protein